MLHEIKNYMKGEVIFSQLCDELKNAVESAVKRISLSKADLRGADLRDADLSNADLRGADLSDANLCDAYLRGAELRGAYLSGANLSNADLCDANLSNADLSGADLWGANLSGADLRNADICVVPRIENIHKTVYESASADGGLNMNDWHTCETTHCRAGWVTNLAGPEGLVLESEIGASAAAALIYIASDPSMGKIPDFYAENEEALRDMKSLADIEAQRNIS